MKLTYNPRILKQLGTELITKDEIAISELIKNSYDAKAENVTIHFFDSIEDLNPKKFLVPFFGKVEELLIESSFQNLMVIEDDGEGMDYFRLKNAFFEVGTTSKFDQINENNKVFLGQKGIGRLSAQKIAPILWIETSDGNGDVNLVQVDWEKFISDRQFDAPEFTYKNINNRSFTRLWLISDTDKKITFDNFFEELIQQEKDIWENPVGARFKILKITPSLQSTISFLYSPFEKEKSLLNLKFFYNDKIVSSKFNTTALDVAESIHSFTLEEKDNDVVLKMEMKVKPWFIERLHRSWIKEKLLISSYVKDHTFYSMDILKPLKERYKKNLCLEYSLNDLNIRLNKKCKNEIDFIEQLRNLIPVMGKVYSFKRDAALRGMAIRSAIENNYLANRDNKSIGLPELLESHNGIKLFRNKHRIATLGNKDNDWLELQQKRTKGQQFFRFDIGNVIGYVSVNDPKQKYITETSSREHLNENEVTQALQIMLDFIFNDMFYEFSRTASLITKQILEEKGLIPKSKEKEVQEASNQISEQLVAAKKGLKAFEATFKVLEKNKELDTPDKIDAAKRIIKEINTMSSSFSDTMNASVQSLKDIDKILAIAREEQNRIKVDAYNNYKLMANGLITETITHEFHSLMQDQASDGDYKDKFKGLKDYLLDTEAYDLNKQNLKPIENKYNSMNKKFIEIELFYKFLEKTFLYKGTMDEFVSENIKSFLQNSILDRYSERLEENDIELRVDFADLEVLVPKGSLVHIFYNLIENSIYWIGYRQRQAMLDSTYQREGEDFIEVRKKDGNTIQILDSGTGVLEAFQYTLFQPLQSGKKSNGRGMGLYIVSNFLDSFDSKIRLTDDVNEYGNRYIFEIEFNSLKK
ncbi:ATP-binding protein [Marinifilum sp.]|uniref:ATP-binding protein n=1 Tax=Marinifilum sp. TaxID=2033137 RepID=UPI003BABC3F2